MHGNKIIPERESREKGLRLFIGLYPPGAVLSSLEIRVHELNRDPAARILRWLPRPQWHFTLQFFGNVATSRVPSLETALLQATREMEPFDVALGGVGAFPSARRPRVFWTGVGIGHDAMTLLADKISVATGNFVQNPSTRPFHPHLTLAYVKEHVRPTGTGLVELIDRNAGPAGERWRADRIALVKSDLGKGGAQHSLLHEFLLGGAS